MMVTAPLGTTLRYFDLLFGRGTVAGLSDGQLLSSYVEHRDDTAFAALVARHGPMVLSVCRGVLRDPLDAEDAYQATFLILVRKAGTVRRVDALGGWLHRVAHRVALQARADAAHRRTEEQKAGQNAVARGSSSATAETEELRRVLHAEIDRLPERLRLPLVLCDLEGLTREEAAGRLRWTEGTVRGRLAREGTPARPTEPARRRCLGLRARRHTGQRGESSRARGVARLDVRAARLRRPWRTA